MKKSYRINNLTFVKHEESIIFFVIVVCAALGLHAQTTINVRGTVKDALTNEELIGGVTVLVVETGAGTVTGVNGNFELDVPVNNTLRISYVGYSIQEIVITNQTFLEINLQPETQLIDELVVVGYSVQKKVDSYRGGSTCQR